MQQNKSSLLELLSEPIYEAIEKHRLSDDQAIALIKELIANGHSELLPEFKKSAASLAKSAKKQARGFEKRNYRRWKSSLDLLLLLWECSQELGQDHANRGPYDSDIVVFDTLAQLHPRALLITSEIQCLLKGGFADGALARWRSLHEVAVVAMFIAKHGKSAALGYRMSLHFSNNRAAKQVNKHAERSGLSPVSKGELEELEALCQQAEQTLGKRLKSDWDWAADQLNKSRVSFADIEESVGLDHWRPRFRWSSQHIHAGSTRPDKLLGMSEASSFFFQIGPSNSGLVDPIYMTAISLAQITTTFLLFPEPEIDRVIYCKLLLALSEEVGASAENHRVSSVREPDTK